MPLLVVPLAADESELLTLREWDLLRAREQVLFEDPNHPLQKRLTDAGVSAGPLDDEPAAEDESRALVVAPDSARLLELARAGAEILVLDVGDIDALTAGYGAAVARRAARSFAHLTSVMARLRGPDGCPWDQEQTHISLQNHLLEEAHEVLDTIDRGELTDALEEELGDLLLQVVFHAQLAHDDNRFDIAGVTDAIAAKLVHRHPHVFGDVEVSGASEVVHNWEEMKAKEKERTDPFADIPASLPALATAAKTLKRARGLGFETDEEAARKQAESALQSGPGGVNEDAIGEALFWIVALARTKGIDPEGALRNALVRFRASLHH